LIAEEAASFRVPNQFGMRERVPEISKWDDRFERQQAPWIELAAGLAAATILMASFWGAPAK
jgi:hypothetical protein